MKERRQLDWWRILPASILVILTIGIVLPDTGRIVADRSTDPPTMSIQDRPQHIAMLAGMVATPLLCIYFGKRRSSLLEYLGWILLAALTFLAMNKGNF